MIVTVNVFVAGVAVGYNSNSAFKVTVQTATSNIELDRQSSVQLFARGSAGAGETTVTNVAG
jgi:hypothetical protein